MPFLHCLLPATYTGFCRPSLLLVLGCLPTTFSLPPHSLCLAVLPPYTSHFYLLPVPPWLGSLLCWVPSLSWVHAPTSHACLACLPTLPPPHPTTLPAILTYTTWFGLSSCLAHILFLVPFLLQLYCTPTFCLIHPSSTYSVRSLYI